MHEHTVIGARGDFKVLGADDDVLDMRASEALSDLGQAACITEVSGLHAVPGFARAYFDFWMLAGRPSKMIWARSFQRPGALKGPSLQQGALFGGVPLLSSVYCHQQACWCRKDFAAGFVVIIRCAERFCLGQGINSNLRARSAGTAAPARYWRRQYSLWRWMWLLCVAVLPLDDAGLLPEGMPALVGIPMHSLIR